MISAALIWPLIGLSLGSLFGWCGIGLVRLLTKHRQEGWFIAGADLVVLLLLLLTGFFAFSAGLIISTASIGLNNAELAGYVLGVCAFDAGALAGMLTSLFGRDIKTQKTRRPRAAQAVWQRVAVFQRLGTRVMRCYAVTRLLGAVLLMGLLAASLLPLEGALAAARYSRPDNNSACHKSCDILEFFDRQRSLFEMTLGMLYFNGSVFTQDYSKALVWLQKSAQHGHPGAAAWLGHMLKDGIGTSPDATAAAGYFGTAAEAGNPYAATMLADQLLSGEGIKKDELQAFTNYMNAAQQGYPAGEVGVGKMYQNGFGVALNYATSMQWYKRAASHNSADAKARIGYLYENGLGVERDYDSAMTWYQDGYAAGSGFGAARIGWMYQNAFGVDRDYAKALLWYRRAVAAGNHSSEAFIASICKQRQVLTAASGQSYASWGCAA